MSRRRSFGTDLDTPYVDTKYISFAFFVFLVGLLVERVCSIAQVEEEARRCTKTKLFGSARHRTQSLTQYQAL